MKSNSTHRGRLNAKGYKQVHGHHYTSDSIAMPVTNLFTEQTVLMLWYTNPRWMSAIINVEGAFLQGHFENGKELYLEVPDGFERHYSGDVVL